MDKDLIKKYQKEIFNNWNYSGEKKTEEGSYWIDEDEPFQFKIRKTQVPDRGFFYV
jgi:hypothetical protein